LNRLTFVISRALKTLGFLLAPAALGALPLLGLSAADPAQPALAAGTIPLADVPYLPGSRIPISVGGFSPPFDVGVLGPGTFAGGVLSLPMRISPGDATIVAGNGNGLAMRTFRLAAPPPRDDALIAVAAYGNGVAFHRADTFASLGILATGGAPSDVAFDAEGTLSATDTDGDALTQASLAPWGVRAIPSVPEGDEIAVDPRTQDVLTTNRDVDGGGALTRVGHDGTVSRVATGATAEGLAVDSMHDRTYVADVNDGSVAVVRTSTMRVIGKISTVARDFSLALSADGSRLYVVSNQSLGSPFGAAGRVVAIALDAAKPHAVAISAALEFPLGIALDEKRSRVFVTDEAAHRVYVLDATTLAPVRAPLATCQVPWKPTFDPIGDRLYVPCARSNRVDVFDARTLARVAGAPFRTAEYPLAVAVWHPPA
jgi:DNA-binding beta-propeller fold protein YncE